MRVLFTHSYFLHLDPKQEEAGKPYPPLAPLYAAALLRQNNFEVAMADLQLSPGPAELRNHIGSFKPDVLVIYDDGFNYLSKMCLTNMREAVFRMIEIAKKNSLPVVISSSDASDHLTEYFNHGADYIIIGEAEHTLLELLEELKNGNTAPRFVAGLTFLTANEIHKNSSRQVMRDLDQLPVPAWDLVDLQKYRSLWIAGHGYFSLNMVSTRGCPYKCNWCAKPIYGNRYNSHSAARVVDEIERLKRLIPFDHIWFADDIFGLKPGFVKNFRDEIKKRQLKIRFKIQSRADLLLEQDTIDLLAESGCDEVWMGAESGSQKILDAMDKGITIDQIEKATALLHRAGIKPCFFLQFGYKGESAEDIRMTIALMDRLKPFDIGVSVSYPLPGTGFYESVKKDLQHKTNWSDSDDLDMMFAAGFPSDFYRHLQKYVHYRFRSSQSLVAFQQYRLTAGLIKWPYYVLKRKLLKKKLLGFPDFSGAL